MMGERIKRARAAAGLSQRDAAERADLSPMAISKFERDEMTPASDTLMRLARALGVRVEFFLRPESRALEKPQYRKRSSLGAKRLAKIEADVFDQVERFHELLELFPQPPVLPFAPPVNLPRHIANYDQLERAALCVRDAWRIGYDAIPNLADLLEEHGVLVLQTAVDDSEKFDGLATNFGGTHVIVIGAAWPGDRQRFTMAHELGHLVLAGRLAEGLDDEKACNRFAGAFLATDPAVRSELGEYRHRLEPSELHTLKHRYGLSMFAWIFRARDLGIIGEGTAKTLFQRFSSVGWRKKEPGIPLAQETPRLFDQLVVRALAEEMISETKAAELAGLRAVEFRDRLRLAGFHGAPRR